MSNLGSQARNGWDNIHWGEAGINALGGAASGVLAGTG